MLLLTSTYFVVYCFKFSNYLDNSIYGKTKLTYALYYTTSFGKVIETKTHNHIHI